MEQLNPREINTTALAFIGDAVYEVFIRKYVMERGPHNAEGQAKAVKSLIRDFLTEEEIAFVKRARNHKSVSKSRSAGPVAYKLATAFEALIGYLYLDGQQERLAGVMEEAVSRIEGDKNE